jgi:hypothetical protein
MSRRVASASARKTRSSSASLRGGSATIRLHITASGRATQGPESSRLAVDPIGFTGVSLGLDRIEDLEASLPEELQREAPPWDAPFLAGKAFMPYRRRGGARHTPPYAATRS